MAKKKITVKKTVRRTRWDEPEEVEEEQEIDDDNGTDVLATVEEEPPPTVPYNPNPQPPHYVGGARYLDAADGTLLIELRPDANTVIGPRPATSDDIELYSRAYAFYTEHGGTGAPPPEPNPVQAKAPKEEDEDA